MYKKRFLQSLFILVCFQVATAPLVGMELGGRAFGFLADRTMDIVKGTAEMVGGALREARRRHKEEVNEVYELKAVISEWKEWEDGRAAFDADVERQRKEHYEEEEVTRQRYAKLNVKHIPLKFHRPCRTGEPGSYYDGGTNKRYERTKRNRFNLEAMLEGREKELEGSGAMVDALQKVSEKAANMGVDVTEKILTEQAAAAAKGAAKVKEQVAADRGKMKRLEKVIEFFQDPKNIKHIVIGAAGIILSYYVIKHGVGIVAEQIKKRLGVPKIIEETNITGFWGRLLRRKKPVISRLDEVVAAPALRETLFNIAEDTRQAHIFGDNLSNILLYGPPGTGKTMFAKALAYHSGLKFARISGSSLSKLSPAEALIKLNEILDWAKKEKNGMVLVWDEIESFLRNRGDESMSEGARMLITEFLALIEKPSNKKLMLVFLTNRPQDLDPAVLSRVGRYVHVPAPAKEQLNELLELYLPKIVDAGIVLEEGINGCYPELAQIASRAKLTGRDIEESFTNQAVRAVRRTGDSLLTGDIARKTLDRYVREKGERDQFVTVA